jgi:hypothetical protein
MKHHLQRLKLTIAHIVLYTKAKGPVPRAMVILAVDSSESLSLPEKIRQDIMSTCTPPKAAPHHVEPYGHAPPLLPFHSCLEM